MEKDSSILFVVLKHYFCGIAGLKTDEQIFKFYHRLTDAIDNNPDITWDQLGESHLIWEPFESLKPSEVINSMENLYCNITDLNIIGKTK